MLSARRARPSRSLFVNPSAIPRVFSDARPSKDALDTQKSATTHSDLTQHEKAGIEPPVICARNCCSCRCAVRCSRRSGGRKGCWHGGHREWWWGRFTAQDSHKGRHVFFRVRNDALCIGAPLLVVRAGCIQYRGRNRHSRCRMAGDGDCEVFCNRAWSTDTPLFQL